MSPEVEDTMARYIALFVLFVVPVALIVLFWMVHVLPEKIAHKRHHPQFEAIRTLCLLSLVFGGLLWPIAWLWAYTKPVGYKTRLRHRQASRLLQGARPAASRRARRRHAAAPGRLEDAACRPSELDAIRADLAALEARLAAERPGSEVS